MKKYLETSVSRVTTYQNPWDAAKAVQRRKSIAIQAYLKKQEKSKINNITLHLKETKRINEAQNQKEGNNKDMRGNK